MLVVHAAAGEGETAAGVGGEKTGVAEHVKSAGRDEGAEAGEEVAGLETEDVAAAR